MTVPYSYELSHDSQGRIVEKTETVAGEPVKWTYAYDKAGRLAKCERNGWPVCDCWYDRAGRRACDSFPKSVEGDLRSMWNHKGKYTLYEYSPDYRLLKADQKDEGRTFTFRHDDEGRRIAKYCNGELVEAYEWLDFIRLAGYWDGRNSYEFAYEDDERTPYAMRRDDGGVAYLFHDQVGSLRVVTDTSGNVIKTIQYDPFGGVIEDSNPDFKIPLGFAGGLHDHDLGFVRFGFRDYDTYTSRWTAPDPIGDAGGDSDWYGYCLDDPVNGVDPLGLRGLFSGLVNLFNLDDANAASLTTDMKEGKTTFDPRPEVPDGKPVTIGTRNKVTRNSKAGANDPYKTNDVRVIKTMPGHLQKSYGPDGAYIDTGDSRGRDIHGGGGKTREDAVKPQQGWRPTHGCTRGQNEDVINLGKEILDFQRRFPGVKIPYERK